jgi:hypothetical protein
VGPWDELDPCIFHQRNHQEAWDTFCIGNEFGEVVKREVTMVALIRPAFEREERCDRILSFPYVLRVDDGQVVRSELVVDAIQPINDLVLVGINVANTSKIVIVPVLITICVVYHLVANGALEVRGTTSFAIAEDHSVKRLGFVTRNTTLF